MGKNIKALLSIVLCVVLVAGIMSISALAIDAEKYDKLPYKTYTYLGDSISWGYGLSEEIERTDKFSVAKRVPGSFTDLVGTVLEENNRATIYPAACSGARISDYRYLLEQGMGMENAYDHGKDWYGERHPERTEQLLQLGPEICDWVGQSDLVTVQMGINDITATLVNAASATGIVDLPKIQEISDLESAFDYVAFVVNNVSQDPNVIGNFVNTFINEITGISENIEAVVSHVETIAGEDADILVLGYHHAAKGLRVIPGTDYSLVFDLVDRAIDLFNNMYRNAAAKYDNVYYVDIPDSTVAFPEGTTVVDALGTGVYGILAGLHPDAAGHEYIAGRVLDELMEINDTVVWFDDVYPSDWFYPYVKYVTEKGIFAGTSPTVFEPNTPMTRGMFVTVLWAREGKPAAAESNFKDLKADWYKTAVAWAAVNGIVGGYDDDIFGPDDPMTREQMATILYQYAKYKNLSTSSNSDLSRFPDSQSVSDYAVTPMKWAVGQGILNGTNEGLEPQGTATRAQVAVVMKSLDEV